MTNLTASNLTSITKEIDSSTQDERQHGFRAVYLIINVVINTIACPFTVGLNMLVIVAIKRRPSLRGNVNIMLACLAVTDVLTGLTSQPSIIIWNLSQLSGTEERFAVFFMFKWFFFSWLALSSCLHLMAVVCERLVAIKFPYRYNQVVTKRNIKLAILFSWIYSVTCRIVLYQIGIKSSLYGIYAAHIPTACVIFVSCSYAVLYSESRRHKKLIKAQCLSQEDVERFLKDSKALKTTVLVVAALGLCIMPGTLYLVLRHYVNAVNSVSEIVFTLITINSLLNPLIYCWRQRELRKFIFKPLSHQAVLPID